MATEFRRVGDNSSKAAHLQTYCKYLHKPQPLYAFPSSVVFSPPQMATGLQKRIEKNRMKLEGQLLKTLSKIITEIISQKG